MKSLPALVLASTSAYRRDLLARLKIPYDCAAPGVDEAHRPGELARDVVVRLAHAKASAIAVQRPDAWVIGSDQVAVLRHDGEERIFGKPGSVGKCQDQLRACSGRTLAFLTAVAVVRHGGPSSEFVDTTHVTFRTLDEASIERYVARESPLDCAGGFKSECLGITLCESIDSQDPTALIGLPLIRLAAALRSAGFALP